MSTVPEVTGPQTITVTYSNSGYEPKTITIKQGDRVTWVNESTRNLWVASANHPIHSKYPELIEGMCLGSAFDACEQIPTGGSWSFTFNNIGKWGYHNHLSPSKFGVVIVK